MNDLTRATGSPFDALRHEDERGEWWSARELVEPVGYASWQKFSAAIERGRSAIALDGGSPESEINPTVKIAVNARGERRKLSDFRMTREGVYAALQGADPNMPEIAAAWKYFRVRTRQAEQMADLDPDLKVMRDLVFGIQQVRNEQDALKRKQLELDARQADLTVRQDTLAEDVKEISAELDAVKALTPLVGSDEMTIRDAAHAVTGQDMGQNTFAVWLRERKVLFKDHNGFNRPFQAWVERGWAIESYEQAQNGTRMCWVTRFTALGIAKLNQMWSDGN
jgi:hypothetical protein